MSESFLLQGRAEGLGIPGGEEEAEMDDYTGVSIPTGRQRIKGRPWLHDQYKGQVHVLAVYRELKGSILFLIFDS